MLDRVEEFSAPVESGSVSVSPGVVPSGESVPVLSTPLESESVRLVSPIVEPEASQESVNSEVPLTSIEPKSVSLEVVRSEVSSGESVVPPGVCPTVGSVPPEVVHYEGSSVEFMDVDPVSVDSEGLVEFPPCCEC